MGDEARVAGAWRGGEWRIWPDERLEESVKTLSSGTSGLAHLRVSESELESDSEGVTSVHSGQNLVVTVRCEEHERGRADLVLPLGTVDDRERRRFLW